MSKSSKEVLFSEDVRWCWRVRGEVGVRVYVKLACETSRRTAGSRRGREERGECRGGVANRKFLGLL